MIAKEKLIEYYKIDKEELKKNYNGDIVHYLCDNNKELNLVKLMKEYIIREINNMYELITTSFVFNNLSSKDESMFYDYNFLSGIKDYNELGQIIKLKKIPLGNYYISLISDLEYSDSDMEKYYYTTTIIDEINKYRKQIETVILEYDNFYFSDYLNKIALEMITKNLQV